MDGKEVGGFTMVIIQIEMCFLQLLIQALYITIILILVLALVAVTMIPLGKDAPIAMDLNWTVKTVIEVINHLIAYCQ